MTNQLDSILTAEEHVLEAQPTAWRSVPGFVRFAVWVWAVLLVLSVALGVLFGVYLAVNLGGDETPDIPDIVVPSDGFSIPAEDEGLS